LEKQIYKADIQDEAGSFDFSYELVDHEHQQRDVEETKQNIQCDKPSSITSSGVPFADTCMSKEINYLA
jgi:hypothetical protein